MFPLKNKVSIDYDRQNDVLYVNFGMSRPSYCVAQIDDVFIMKDIETNEYSGVKILDFLERLQDGSLFELHLPFDIDFDIISKQIFKTPAG